MKINGSKKSDVLVGTAGDDVIVGGSGKPVAADLNNVKIAQDTVAKVTFQGETADYQNAVGVYKIAPDGSIYDVQIMFANGSLAGSGGDLVAGQSSVDLALNAGDQLGFFVVPNAYAQPGMAELLSDKSGSFVFFNWYGELGNVNSPTELTLVHISEDGSKYTEIKTQNWTSLVHSTQGGQDALNGDGLMHAAGTIDRAAGTLTIGFEDTMWVSDGDFDDAVFTIDLGVENTVNLASTTTANPGVVYGDDVLSGGDGSDTILGVKGNDKLFGEAGDDKLFGGSGNDTLSGGEGNDTIKGGSGDDVIYADQGNDDIVGGGGIDVVSFAGAVNGVTVNLNAKTAAGLGTDKISGVEAVVGSSFDDTITGDKRANYIEGGDGNDVIRGLGGEDWLSGGEGADTFVWQAKDIVSGGAHVGVDTVRDFGDGDVLDLQGVFKGVKGDHLANVTLVDNGTDSMLMAKIGGAFVEVALLKGVTGTTVAELHSEGSLLV